MQFDDSFYLIAENIRESTNKMWTPELIYLLISSLIPNATKQAVIGQSNATMFCYTTSDFGLGVECDHVFGSKWLINELHQLGFGVSHSEVTRYKQSVLSHENIYKPEVNSNC